jgi:3-deoxy-7-phosphoheptulonate synthase
LIVVFDTAATSEDLVRARALLESSSVAFRTERAGGTEVWVVDGEAPREVRDALASLPGVRQAGPLREGYVLASRSEGRGSTTVQAGPARIGGRPLVLAAGPCAIEGPEQIEACAAAVKAAGGTLLRGGSFKPRTSPYAFQGLGEEGLRLHREACDRHGLAMVSEVLDREDLPRVAEFADMIQVGSRNMQNFPLLKALGRLKKSVLLKRGLAATREEFLLAAEYVLAGGNPDVVLCERGVRSFDPSLRNSLDLGSVVLLKEMTHLPVLVDPSHASGARRLVLPLARAAAVAGADGLLVEVHPDPHAALSDGPQALLPEELGDLARDLKALAPVVGRTFGDGA